MENVKIHFLDFLDSPKNNYGISFLLDLTPSIYYLYLILFSLSLPGIN